MRAIRFETTGQAHVVDIPRPTPGPGEALVRVGAAGVCGSDLAALRGKHPFRFPPLISGHEAGGWVESLGDGVDGLAVGDLVAIEPQRACGQCELCGSGQYHLCRRKQMLGIAEWDGAFAELVLVPANTLVVVPPELGPATAALIEPLAVACRAVGHLEGISGGTFLVLGGGTIGAYITLVLKHEGAARVVVREPREGNHALLRGVGADEVLLPDEGDAGGYDGAFVAAGVPALLDDALAAVRPAGTVVQVAIFNAPVPVDVGRLQIDEKRLQGTAVYTRDDFVRAIEVAGANREKVDSVVSHRLSLEAGAELITAMARDGGGSVMKLLVDPALTES